MTQRTHHPDRGASLIETMIAMAILTIGLLGMWSMHHIGIASTSQGRRTTIAMAMAQELAAGLERLSYADGLLTVTGSTGPTAPAAFGRLQFLSPIPTDVHAWSDSKPVPGVRLDSEIKRMSDSAYERRWSVWGYSPAPGSPSTVKLVAVSVTWGTPASEVIVYTQLVDQSSFASTLGANQ